MLFKKNDGGIDCTLTYEEVTNLAALMAFGLVYLDVYDPTRDDSVVEVAKSFAVEFCDGATAELNS